MATAIISIMERIYTTKTVHLTVYPIKDIIFMKFGAFLQLLLQQLPLLLLLSLKWRWMLVSDKKVSLNNQRQLNRQFKLNMNCKSEKKCQHMDRRPLRTWCTWWGVTIHMLLLVPHSYKSIIHLLCSSLKLSTQGIQLLLLVLKIICNIHILILVITCTQIRILMRHRTLMSLRTNSHPKIHSLLQIHMLLSH